MHKNKLFAINHGLFLFIAILVQVSLYTKAFPDKIDMTEPTAPIASPIIEQSLIDSFTTHPTQTIIITFKAGTSEVLEALSSKTFASREERLNGVHNALKTHADSTQTAVMEYLKEKSEADPSAGITFDSKWINNSIIVKGANLGLVEGLRAFDEILEVHEDKVVAQIQNPVQEQQH